jgi:dephospho-CoA kinase
MRKTVIGVTGSFGSGKSTVSSAFSGLGAYVLDADKIAKKILKKKAISGKIKNEFGTTGRKKLADIVFSDTKKLEKLNRIIHPEVRNEIKRELKRMKKSVIVIDIPLLIEAGMADLTNKIIVVKASRKKIISRSKLDKRNVLKRMKSQMPLRKKLKYADYVINNNGTKNNTKKQVMKIINEICG